MENGETITVNETTNKLPVGTIDSVVINGSVLVTGASAGQIMNNSNEYTTVDEKNLQVIVTFSVSSLDTTDLTVNAPLPDFIIFGIGLDAVNLDDYDLRDVNLSHTNMKTWIMLL